MFRAHSIREIAIARRRQRERRDILSVLRSRGLIKDEASLNFYRKNRPFGCHSAHCKMCNYGKTMYSTRKEMLAKIDTTEQLKELGLI